MHHASHICMNQTDKLEVAGNGKSDGETLPFCKGRSADAGSAIEAAGSASCKPGTTHLKSQPYLGELLKSHGMDLVGIGSPGDVVTCVNPEFVGKKSQSLMSQGLTLGAHGGLPLGLCHLWETQQSQDEHRNEDPRTEDPRKRNRIKSLHLSLLVSRSVPRSAFLRRKSQ